jgi:hypothetical protein
MINYVKENAMGRACSTNWGGKGIYSFLVENEKEIKYCGDKDMGRKVILR